LRKAAVIKKAAKAGISKRTVERALAKPKKPKKAKPPVDKLKEGYIGKRFQKFMDH
jgi:hypothetical protein